MPPWREEGREGGSPNRTPRRREKGKGGWTGIYYVQRSGTSGGSGGVYPAYAPAPKATPVGNMAAVPQQDQQQQSAGRTSSSNVEEDTSTTGDSSKAQRDKWGAGDAIEAE